MINKIDNFSFFSVDETFSTNNLLHDMLVGNPLLDEGFVLTTEYQLSGRGQRGNVWHSEKGRNLLFSVLLRPKHIKAKDQFILSMIISLAIKRTLDIYSEHFSIKWPNDIYWKDKKIGGMLIENSLVGDSIRHSIAGVGLNVNQTSFPDNIPNPISISTIVGHDVSRKSVLDSILNHILQLDSYSFDNLKEYYMDCLYRRDGVYGYKDSTGEFMASIKDITPEGYIILQKESDGKLYTYALKELTFVID